MHAAVHEACSLLTLAWLQDFKIQNVVGSADVKFPVRLEGLSFAHSLFCSVSTSPRPDFSLCCVTSLGSWPAHTSWQLHKLNLPDSNYHVVSFLRIPAQQQCLEQEHQHGPTLQCTTASAMPKLPDFFKA